MRNAETISAHPPNPIPRFTRLPYPLPDPSLLVHCEVYHLNLCARNSMPLLVLCPSVPLPHVCPSVCHRSKAAKHSFRLFRSVTYCRARSVRTQQRHHSSCGWCDRVRVTEWGSGESISGHQRAFEWSGVTARRERGEGTASMFRTPQQAYVTDNHLYVCGKVSYGT